MRSNAAAVLLTIFALFATSCASSKPAPPASAVPPVPAPPPAKIAPEERHFGELRQLTNGGENAEAYWSFDGARLSLQARREGEGCDRIAVLSAFSALEGGAVPAQVSSGKGATTCAHFLPGGDELIYASTHLGGDACPPRPDMSLGYVWALYDTYDIFKQPARAGAEPVRLTDVPGYDAEGTVCGKDGSILFTSVRDGDIDLYRMDKEGKNVKRLTREPGYDGGAFFNADCTKIVWRASRPRPGKELDDYKALLGRALVRPTKLELFVANADGSDARQVTYLNAASFAPFFYPNRDRIIFSSNYGDPKGRDFDLWAINSDGTQLERITHSAGFDGFPMFSPDGKWLAFSSNRATAPGKSDTNLFLARWIDSPEGAAPAAETAADRLFRDATWIAAPEREGRGVGTKGLEQAGAWIEERFKALGLEPLVEGGNYRESFKVKTAARAGEKTGLVIDGAKVAAADFMPIGWSGQGSARGPLVLAGYGIEDEGLGIDDYKGLDVKRKIVVVRRFAPEHPKLQTPEAQRRAGDLRKKAFVARSKGAAALIVVDWPAAPAPKPADWKLPAEARLPSLLPEGTGDAGLPVVLVKRAAVEKSWPRLESKGKAKAEITIEIQFEQSPAFNVVGRLRAKPGKSAGEAVTIIGAHYDHLGFGGESSLAPEKNEPHLGADDNGSGSVTLLEIARALSERRDGLARDVVFVAFSGEETGVVGSSALVQARPQLVKAGSVMLNMDMVGRLRENQLSVLGAESADGWAPLIDEACTAARVHCAASGDGYGPSDHMPFYTAGIPVLHFFSGAHSDYHKPSDSADKLNYGGMAQIAQIVAAVAERVPFAALAYKKAPLPASRGDARSFNASLGTVPDYGGPPAGIKGVLLSDVRPGGGADKAGMRRGDVIQRIGKYQVGSVEDLMFVLMSSKPGETASATVLRDGKVITLEVTFQEGRRR